MTRKITDKKLLKMLAPKSPGKRPTQSEFVTGYKRGEYQVGIVTEDGRCRMDTNSGLEGWTFWETQWIDPKNPWLGGRPLEQVHGLEADYT